MDQTAQIKEKELLALIDKNRALDATYKLVDIVLESIEFEEMTQKIADIIPKAMGYQIGTLFLADYKNQKLLKTSVSKTYNDSIILKSLDNPDREISISFGYEDNFSVRCLKEKKQYISDNLYDLFKPTVTSEDCRIIQHVLEGNSCVVTPLIAKGKAIGVLMVVMTKEVSEISDFEKEMLKKFAENAGIAVENARLFSNLKLAKDELHKAYENLKVLNKLKDEFLSVASHELRTPMTIVKSYLWMLEKQKSGKLNTDQMKYLEKALTGTQRMIDLINDMLDISRFEQNKVSFEMKQVDLCAVVKEMIGNFDLEAKEKGIYLKYDDSCKDALIDADISKLRDILTNLIANAIKFTKEGGVEIGIEDENEFLKVWVKDSGSGIDPRDIHKLFHKFGRIDNSYTIATDPGGTGLGLYIVKIYTEGMGGKVGAWSEGPGKGSTFWVTLPRNKITRFGENLLQQVYIPAQKVVPPDQANNTS